MPVPYLMFEHTLTALKGWFDIQGNLDFVAKLSPNVTFAVPQGRVVHLNTENPPQFEVGVANTDMAIFLIQGSDASDVNNPTFTAAGTWVGQAIAPAGHMSGLVASGGYELESTEFDQEQDYLPNELLTAGHDNTDAATGGVITNVGTGSTGNVQQFVDPVIGVVSRGAYINASGMNCLAFWTEYIPGSYET